MWLQSQFFFPPPPRWDQNACALLHNMHWKKGMIILRNDTLQLSQIVVHEVHNKFIVLFDSALYSVELFVEYK